MYCSDQIEEATKNQLVNGIDDVKNLANIDNR